MSKLNENEVFRGKFTDRKTSLFDPNPDEFSSKGIFRRPKIMLSKRQMTQGEQETNSMA